MEQRQTAPAQDTERAVVDLETFERVWRRVMPNQDMSPIQVGAPTGPGTGGGAAGGTDTRPGAAPESGSGAAPAAQIQSSAQLQPQSQVPVSGGAGRWAGSAAGGVDGRGLDGPQDLSGAGPAGLGSGARTLNALAAEQRRTAQRLAACWFLLTGACYHFSSPPIPRVCPLAAALREQFLQGAEVETVMPAGGSGRGQHRLRGGCMETLDGQAEHRMEAIRCLLEQMQPLPSGG